MAVRIEELRRILDEHQAAEIEETIVDATTAKMLVTVHDALSEKNRAKFLSLDLTRMVSIGWELVA